MADISSEWGGGASVDHVSVLTQCKIRYGLCAKRFPPLFDCSKRLLRLLGMSDPIYRCLKKFSRRKNEVVFLQIGSNDGISQDPLREFIVRSDQWTGCFVEPLPHLFNKLEKSYAYLNRDNLRYTNAAVSDRRGEIDLYRIRNEYHPEFPCFVDQIASFRESHIFQLFPGHPQIAHKTEKVTVEMISIKELVSTNPGSRLDLLHLDVEGHECIIISSFPFERCRPEVILFEAGHLSLSERETVDEILGDQGYTLVEAGIDILALQPEAVELCKVRSVGRL